MRCYDLIYKGKLPGGRSHEFQPYQGGRRESFFAPSRSITILSTRYEQIGQIARVCIATVEMPEWLSGSNRLDPEIDGTPQHVLDEIAARAEPCEGADSQLSF